MSLMNETDPHSLKEHPVIGEDVYIHSTHLTPQELYLLEQVYQELLPEYAAHVLQYETARERARDSRNVSLLPPRDKCYQSPGQNVIF